MALNLKLFTTNFKLQTFNLDYELRTTNLPKKFCLKEETFRQNFFFFAIMLSRRVEMW